MIESTKKLGFEIPRISNSTPAPQPKELLAELTHKQRLYKLLNEEGLIHENRYATIQKELTQAVEDLKILIPLLEEK